VALGQVFSENFGFPCQSTFHLFLHNHLHYHPRLAQQARSGRIANNLTNRNLKKKLLNEAFSTALLIYHQNIYLYNHYLEQIRIFKSRSQWQRGINHLRSLERWSRRFKSHSRHGCLYCVRLFCVCVVLCVR
jgi:hypothetical protein